MIIPGVLYLSSKTIYGFTRNNVPKRRFRPCMDGLSKNVIYVATKKKMSCNDVYATVRKNDNDTYTLVSILGNVGEYNIEKIFIRYQYQINRRKIIGFSDLEEDLTPDREDLTSLNCYSIDPENCEDIDDLLSYHILNDNICVVGIHIADVSSFIKEGSELDNIIRDRAETIYYKDNRDDMLPISLAINKCSLTKGDKKRAYSILFTIDRADNTIISARHTKSYVINKNKLSYAEAERLIADKTYFDLNMLYDIGKSLADELYDTHKMVEVFMIKANTYVGDTIKDKENAIIRIQDTPLMKLYNGEDNDINDIINSFKRERARYVLSNDTDNNYHSGLNVSNYTHFTSPIRRYADILVHRLLYDKAYINNDICDNLNKKHRSICMAYRDFERLDRLYDIRDMDDIVEGTIVYINDNKIRIYVKDLNIEGICKLFSKKVAHLICYESTDNYVKINNDISLRLCDKVKVKLAISIKTPKVKDKLLIQLIEPDLRHITYKNFL